MRKKQLVEQLAALKQKRADENARLTKLSAEGTEVPVEALEALFAMDPEVEKLEAELSGIEKLEAAAKRSAESAKKADPSIKVGDDNREKKPWESLGEFLCSVAKASTPGETTDPRLHQLASGASEGVPSDGGFLVQTEWSDKLYQNAIEDSNLASLCTDLNITRGNATSIPFVNETSRATGSRWGGIRVYRAAEAETVAASKPKIDRMEIKLEKLMGLAYATEELLEDAPLIEQVFDRAFRSEFSFVIDDEIVWGNGAGQSLGFMNSGAVVSVAKESGQAAATVLAENIVKMFARMMPRAQRRSAVWLVNTDVTPQLSLMKVGDTPVYLPPGGLSNDPFGRLMGRPVIPIEQAETIGTLGDIMFVDLEQYALARKGGLKAVSSMHVRFIYDEMTFRFTTRVMGQPLMKSAITPYKGSNSLSAFVALATRS